jgi:hypothetical protein
LRLWTLHPRYLDSRGLVAVWREGLLARAVLRNRTRGYRAHPQLARFRAHPAPIAAINTYLAGIRTEASRRGYRFDARKCRGSRTSVRIRATRGQVRLEWAHLLRKLRDRAPALYRAAARSRPGTHPLFRVIAGRVEDWEVRRR